MILYFWMIIQLLCESLPISSSGHVALMQKITAGLNLSLSLPCEAWAFDYLLQGASAMVIVAYFFSSWWQLVIKKPITLSALFDKNEWSKNIAQVFMFGVAADSMTILFWFFNIADHVLIPLAAGFAITAVVLWSIQFATEKKDLNIWAVRNGFIVGVVQGCALLPGVSRFGATFAALKWLGYQNRDAFSISFLIQWPLIVAGAIVGCVKLFYTFGFQDFLTFNFIICTAIAGLGGYGLLCLMQKIIDKNSLWKFSYYMTIPVVIALLIGEM